MPHLINLFASRKIGCSKAWLVIVRFPEYRPFLLNCLIWFWNTRSHCLIGRFASGIQAGSTWLVDLFPKYKQALLDWSICFRNTSRLCLIGRLASGIQAGSAWLVHLLPEYKQALLDWSICACGKEADSAWLVDLLPEHSQPWLGSLVCFLIAASFIDWLSSGKHGSKLLQMHDWLVYFRNWVPARDST